MRTDDYPMTPASIAAAQAAAEQERAAIRAATGIVIDRHGRIVRQPVLVPCGICRFVASALSESRALDKWANHAVMVHGWPSPKCNG